MTSPRPDLLFRLGGLVACVIVALPLMAHPLAGDIVEMLRSAGITDLSRINLTGTRIVLAAVPALFTTLFAGAFWLNTRPDTLDRRRRRGVALLVLQAFLAFWVTDYFVVVAAQVPFVFAPRGAFIWLGGQLVGFLISVAVAVRLGTQVTIPEMAWTPGALAVALSIVNIAGWQFFAFSVGYLAASERRAHRELHQRSRELLATQQMLADSSRVAERAQISRELHDTLGHSLTVLNVNLELASHLIDGRAAEAVTKAQTVARLLLADVREVVHALGDARAIDVRRALSTLAEGAHTPAVQLSMPETLTIDDPELAHAIFRCVQEAITNAVRHAHAKHLWIDLVQGADGLELHIRDDGDGDSAVRPGRGLSGMRERLEAAGGRLTLATSIGQGFRIDVWIPMSTPLPSTTATVQP